MRVGSGDFSRSRRADSLLLFVVALELVLLRRRKMDWVFWDNDERVADVGAGDG